MIAIQLYLPKDLNLVSETLSITVAVNVTITLFFKKIRVGGKQRIQYRGMGCTLRDHTTGPGVGFPLVLDSPSKECIEI